jgi:4-amino-4-deoxy-L-arabinose transferase-like glycosyltransferase
MKLLWQKRIVFFLILIGAVLWLWGITYPFVGSYNTNNNYLSLAAKNYLRFGFTTLKFFPTYFAGAHFMPGDPYYLHHPILVFWLEALSVFLFGTANWVIHLPQVLFAVASMAMVYLIAKRLWNRHVALWSLGLAVIFPMTGFFWKYMLFEQACLFFNLVVYYIVILYVRKPNPRYLVVIFFATLLSGLTDWGVLYLLFPFIIFFFTKLGKRIAPAIIAYLAGTVISLGLFLLGVLALQKGFGELSLAIWVRSYTAELTGLSLWPVRLLAISRVRIFLYFSPFAFVSGVYIIKLIGHRESWKLPDITLIFFFLFGLLNLIFLPTATWGHSYFLYYFIPFFAWTGGLWLERSEKKSWAVCFWVAIIIITSVTVTYFKIQQIKKQLWKYDVAKVINTKLAPYETIGVMNFAGDVFENYFFHPSQPITSAQLADWTRGIVYPGVVHAVFVCAGPCTAGELQEVERLKSAASVETYTAGATEAWFITKQLHKQPAAETVETVTPSIQTSVGEGNIFLRWYRTVRDALNVGQI